MFQQMMIKFTLNQVPMLKHNFTIANFFYRFKFGEALDGKVWVVNLLRVYLICWVFLKEFC